MMTVRRDGYQARLPKVRTKIAAAKIIPSTMGKLFVIILLIAVFEGAIRKWISPELTNPLVLLRDCLALYGLYWAIKSGKLNGTQKSTHALWLWSALVVLWGFLQLLVNQSSPLIFVVGIRFWLLYLWFAYAATVCLTQDDFRYITNTIFWLLLVMVPLAVVQFYLPPSAFLNKQVDGDEEKVFRVTADIVRTTGTFSFTLGYTTLLAMLTPFVLSYLSPGAKLWGKTWMPKVMLLALAVATMVSGSRAALIMFGLMFIVFVFASLCYSRAAKGGTMISLLGILFMLAFVPYVFSRAVDATQERFESAAESENFTDRVLTIFLGEPGIYENLSLIGAGVGAGSNIASVVATGERMFMLAETEAARIILEGGALGFVFIGLKLLLITLGMKRSFTIAKKTGNTLPLLIWVTLGFALLTWSIIGQLTVNALGYLLLGLGLASLRSGLTHSTR